MPIDSDTVDDAWHDTETVLRDQLAGVLRESTVPWELRYLPGRPGRALTHLARAVDAAVIVVGTRVSGDGARIRESFERSVAMHLAHHQHRPVLTVPLNVADWKEIHAPWAGGPPHGLSRWPHRQRASRPARAQPVGMSGRLPDAPVPRPLSLQRWEHVAFIHWRYPAAALRHLVPAGLQLQEIDGSAWVGLVPFRLARLRAPGLPAVPRWSTFAEFNLRTYVSDGEHDGVLFLRVLCARRLVVGAFRAGLGLPYVHSPGRVETAQDATSYEAAGTRALVVVGPREEPDALATSLTGRWATFTSHLGRLWCVPVEHQPWPLHRARVDRFRTGMLADVGLPPPEDQPLVHWSTGVDVRLGAPRPAAR